jgi:hypothetical protein
MPSSAIAGIRYDAEHERLVVNFVTGRVYEYVDVRPDVARAFRSAFSKDTFFQRVYPASLRSPRIDA